MRGKRPGSFGSVGAAALLILPLAGCRQTVLVQNEGDGGTPDGTTAFCPGGVARRLTFAPESPAVIVALDRSTSMNSRFGESTRIAEARASLSAIVQQYQTVARFGHVDFPGRPCNDGPSCCLGDLLPPTASWDLFRASLHACEGSTAGCATSTQRPTAAALDAAGAAFARLGRDDKRYVLLVTDGPPSCGGSGSGTDGCNDAAIEASALAGEDIPTIVVNVGGASSECLGRVASTGLTEQAITASSRAELDLVFGALLGGIATRACHLDVSSPPDPRESVTLLYNGTPVPYDSRHGWDFDDADMLDITVHGSTCQRLLDEGPEGFDLRACRPAP